MAARRRSHRSIPLIERNRALELRGTAIQAREPQNAAAKGSDTQLSVPALHLPTPRATGRVE